jgi:predicted phage terminase large subunit-like protein
LRTTANIPSNFAKIYTRGKYQTPLHIQQLERKVLELLLSKDKSKLIITFPPRHGKSEFISKYLPAWYLLNYPHKEVILTSYATSFATSWSLKAKQVYSYFRNDLTVDRQGHWETEAGGVMHATGAGGDITGKGADLFIIDDPVKNSEEALSRVYRDKTYEWFNSTAFTRLSPDAKIIVIQTRWHYDDLAGRFIKQGDWELINFPAINEQGEALWPERYPIETLMDIKKQIGSYWFASLYQQTPIISENQIINYDWLKFYEENHSQGIVFQSWDTAFDNKQKNDYSVCTTWKIVNGNNYLIDVFRQKLNFPDLLRNAKALFVKFNPSIILIEKKASGEPLIQSLKELSLPVRAVNPIADKVTRLHAVSNLFENGKVFFPANLDTDIISELTNFPFDVHDDFVDSLSQALEYSKTISNFESLLTYRPKLQENNYYKV